VGDGGRWWDDVDLVMAVVGLRVGLRKLGLLVLGQKSETGPLGLGLGHTVGNSGGGQWGEMVGWCGRGYSGGGVARWAAQAGLRVLGAPLETAVEGGWERWWGGVDEVVVVVCMCIRARARGEPGPKKNRKPSHSGSVSVCIRPAGGGGGSVVSQGPLL
jgi:hypothetical protein